MAEVLNATTAGLDLLIILAHPDDESFGEGGLLAWARESGHRVGYVCATRGEEGEISDPSLGVHEMLGAIRERELRTAMTIAGIEELRILSYRDSGMMGTPPNNDPRSLFQADRSAVLADLVFQIRDLRPTSVITFGPDGVYGHPDHVRIGEIASEAVEVAASDELSYLGPSWQASHLYHVAVATEDLLDMANRNPTSLFGRLPEAEVRKMGIPRAEITHVFDVSNYIADKLRIIACHATQLPFQAEKGSAGDPAMRPRLGRESMKRILLPWNGPETQPDILDRFNSLEMTAHPGDRP